MERRSFLGMFLGVFGYSPKKIIRINHPPLIIIELEQELSHEEVERFQVKFREAYGDGLKLLLLPKGSKVTVTCEHGFVAKEQLGQYSYEVHAENEQEAKQWMKDMGIGHPPTNDA